MPSSLTVSYTHLDVYKRQELRRWLSVNGYAFTDERLVWDKNYLYPVLRVNGGICPALTELQTLTGVLLDGDPRCV